MATKTAKNPIWLRSTVRSTLNIEQRLVDGAATWKAGQFLYGKNDGLIYVCASGATAIHYFALQDLDSVIAETVYTRMGRIRNDDVFEMNELDGAVAEASVGALAALDVTNNLCSVDITDADHDAFIIVSPTWREETYMNDSGDTLARCCATVLDAVCNAEPGAGA